MSTVTKNFSLTKPDATDNIDISVLNGNFDKIDDQLKKAADALPPVATSEVAGIVKPDGDTITVDKDGTLHGANTYELPVASMDTLGGIKIGDNFIVKEDGTVDAPKPVEVDEAPTENSKNVPSSGGTFKMFSEVTNKVKKLDSQISGLGNSLIWKAAVETYDLIVTTYTSPEIGWTVNVLDTGKTYRWDGESWVFVFNTENGASGNSIPLFNVANAGMFLAVSADGASLEWVANTEVDDALGKEY